MNQKEIVLKNLEKAINDLSFLHTEEFWKVEKRMTNIQIRLQSIKKVIEKYLVDVEEESEV